MFRHLILQLITDEADNCGVRLVEFVSDVASGTCPMVITRTYRIVDSCDNEIPGNANDHGR